MTTQAHRLAHSYLDAKQLVISAGYAEEIDWQEGIRFDDLTEASFLREYCWVVFSSGFRESVLRNKFADLTKAFGGLANASKITASRASCRRAAMKVFGHRGKVGAILETCRQIHLDGFDSFRNQLQAGGVEFIDRLPFMGPATSYHLAKNIGLDVMKPDRHLVRIAKASGFESPHDFCESINAVVGDAISVVDIVVWRYATLFPHSLLPGFIPTFFCVRRPSLSQM